MTPTVARLLLIGRRDAPNVAGSDIIGGGCMLEPQRERIDEDISIHIFSVSAGLVGVCLTVVGILRIVISKNPRTLADDLLSFDALLFLLSCSLAYVVLRTRTTRRMKRVEKAADVIFITALVLMAFACAVITYAIV
jgi:hypothetical protein